MEIFKSFGNKAVGHLHFNTAIPIDGYLPLPCQNTKNCFIILYAQCGATVTFDFVEHKTQQDTVFFFNIGQQFQLGKDSTGELVYFNPEFYCIAFHDKELSCDGVLFNNFFETPSLILTKDESALFRKIIDEIKIELNKEDYWTEEMTRTKLKELIITASRTWISRVPDQKDFGKSEDGLSRKFSQLVEANYHELHSVAAYAELLFVTPKLLNRKILREKGIPPNVIIKKRIILQAKRLLVNTDLTVKEISDQLGYNDQSYFIRFFKIQTGRSPIEFRKIAASD